MKVLATLKIQAIKKSVLAEKFDLSDELARDLKNNKTVDVSDETGQLLLDGGYIYVVSYTNPPFHSTDYEPESETDED